MKFIDIPTDNLYKFMAIFGIYLLTISFLPFYYGWVVKYDLSEVEGEREVIDKKVYWINEEIKNLNNQIETFMTEITVLSGISKSEIIIALNNGKSLGDISNKFKEHQVTWQTIESKYIEKNKLFRDQIVKAIQLKTKTKIINQKLKAIVWLSRASLFGFSFGGFFTTLGFGLWYIKFQIIQDMIIKQKVGINKLT